MTSPDRGAPTAAAVLGPAGSPAPLPDVAPADVRRETAQAPPPVAVAPRRPRRAGAVIGASIGIALGAAALLFVLLYMMLALGPGLVVAGGVMAFIPLLIVLLGLRWIDRWEPEPRSALIFAFLWGAGVSVLLALLVDAEIQGMIASSGGDPAAFEFVGAAVQAPVVEEFGKGLGLLLLFWFGRRHFDGPVDGIVYAAAVGAGFAFTENIQYFGIALAQSNGSIAGVGEIFVIRGLMSPFAHVMFTAFTGLALGIAARRANGFLGVFYFLLGLIPAVLLHAFWNGALFFVYDFYGYYALIQVPIFLMVVGLVVLLRRAEAALTRQRLAEYAAVGWFAPEEVTALATPAGRRTAMSWARPRGLGRVMKRYIRDATRLAFARHRIVTGRAHIGAQADESALLASILESRRALRGPAAPAV
ncbi:PrsW family intramembrane metalloprotease [Lysobacter korlensis]|uniref:PrsW family intramembrane metalloprotease n=1 Tax=Lysobacter korlensis TaxID=553636 RepID=A0ABV6RZ05_9GAMM